MDDECKTYLASYNYAGTKWGIEFPAQSIDDAKARLARMSYGQVDGELVMRIPVAAGAGSVLARLIAWTRNALRPSG